MLYFTMPQRRLQVRRLPLHKKETVRVAGWNAAGLADAVPAWRTQSNAPAGPVRMLAQMQMQRVICFPWRAKGLSPPKWRAAASNMREGTA